jgi:hypothetical protein
MLVAALIGAPSSSKEGQLLPRINTQFRDQRLHSHGELLFALMRLERFPPKMVKMYFRTLLPEPDSGISRPRVGWRHYW